MAWDECHVAACATIKKRAELEEISINKAIKKISKETGIPKRTLESWFYPGSSPKPPKMIEPGKTAEEIELCEAMRLAREPLLRELELYEAMRAVSENFRNLILEWRERKKPFEPWKIKDLLAHLFRETEL
jgi:hypothetical protein